MESKRTYKHTIKEKIAIGTIWKSHILSDIVMVADTRAYSAAVLIDWQYRSRATTEKHTYGHTRAIRSRLFDGPGGSGWTQAKTKSTHSQINRKEN